MSGSFFMEIPSQLFRKYWVRYLCGVFPVDFWNTCIKWLWEEKDR